MTVADQKAALRLDCAARRAAVDAHAASRLCARLADIELQPGAVIAGVWPLPGEPDIRPALREFHARGHPLALPQTPARGQRLLFRRWHPGSRMVRERFGTYRPEGDPVEPHLVLVPLLAFDRRGVRLGYGGGYYDRTLAVLPHATAVGFGYAVQEVDRVPTEAHDCRLTLVITDREIISIPAAAG